MAEGRSLTAREAVEGVLASEHADVLREAVALMVREIMELEVAQLAGRAWRAGARPAHCATIEERNIRRGNLVRRSDPQRGGRRS